jgi:hypothetical protein
MDCSAGFASSKTAFKCQECGEGDVCEVGTSLDEIGKEVIETTGSLELSGFTAENFTSTKAEIIETIKQKFADVGIELRSKDIELHAEAFASRRMLVSTFTLQFSVKMMKPTSGDFNTSTTALALNATAISQLLVASVESDMVAVALKIPIGTLTVASVGDPDQEVAVLGHCPAGKFSSGMGECTDCAPGRAAPKGSAGCENCKPGKLAAKAGAAQCFDCTQGMYQPIEESTVCLKCRAHAMTVNNATHSVQGCVCKPDYFDCTSSDIGVCKPNECNECPFHAACELAETLESLQAKSNYWRATNSTTEFHQCPKLGSCQGGQIINGARDSQCAEGYVGVRCESCNYENGYALRPPASKCSKCAPNEGKIAFLITAGLLFALVFLIVITTFQKWPRNWTRIRTIGVVGGTLKGRTGKLTTRDLNALDLLNDALKAGGTGVHTGYELFCRDRRTEGLVASILSWILQRRTDWRLQSEWKLLVGTAKTKYVTSARKLNERELQARRRLYEVELCEDQHLRCWGRKIGAQKFQVCGSDLELRKFDFRSEYKKRVTKIKLLVQFVQIGCQLSRTYRFPLPPLCIRFLDFVKLIDIIDIAKIPVNLDCFHHFSYISRVYLHTLSCLLIMFLIKPQALRNFLKNFSKFCRHSRNVLPDQKASKRIIPTVQFNVESKLERSVWAVQRRWRLNRNISVLRQSLLAKVRRKQLGRDDFLLLFTYAVYSGLCDTCFMYFDCARYEDHKEYLVADVSIKCKGSEAGPYHSSIPYVGLMSVIFALGIPAYYFAQLSRHRAQINPPLKAILKDRDYVAAFAISNSRKFTDKDGTVWTKKLRQSLYVSTRTKRRSSISLAIKAAVIRARSSLVGVGRSSSVIAGNSHAWALCYQDEMGNEMDSSTKNEVKYEWTKRHPELAACLKDKDMKSEFEHTRSRVGFHQAKEFIKTKARGLSLIAGRYEFLWGPYRVDCWYFEVIDMFRRFLVLGLPKVLRVFIPNAGIEIFLGLLIMAVAPVMYSFVCPYNEEKDQQLMILTQLAQTLVVICGMVYDEVPGSLADAIVTVIIILTLGPIFLVLALFVWDPSGHQVRLMAIRVYMIARKLCGAGVSDHEHMNAEVTAVLEALEQENEAAKEVVALAKTLLTEGGAGEAEGSDILLICYDIWQGLQELRAKQKQQKHGYSPQQQGMDLSIEEALRESITELLEALGMSANGVEALLDQSWKRLFQILLSAKKLAIMRLRHKLEPHLCKHGLAWADIVPVLEEVDSLEELQDAVNDPVGLVERLKLRAGPAAKKLAIALIKPAVEPHLRKGGLEWADIVPVLEEVDSLEELRAAVTDTTGFLARIAAAGGPAAKKLAIMHLRPCLDPYVKKHGLEWADIVPVLEEVDSLEELRAAVADTTGFLARIAAAGFLTLIGENEFETLQNEVRHEKHDQGKCWQPGPPVNIGGPREVLDDEQQLFSPNARRGPPADMIMGDIQGPGCLAHQPREVLDDEQQLLSPNARRGPSADMMMGDIQGPPVDMIMENWRRRDVGMVGFLPRAGAAPGPVSGPPMRSLGGRPSGRAAGPSGGAHHLYPDFAC